MAKKINMITAGRAFYIQLDSNPIINGTTNKDGSPLLVPQGSIAYDGNNTYLKMSDADLDWLLLGSAWNFVSDPLLLNPSSQSMLIGTRSGDFDIGFYRNGAKIFDLTEYGFNFPTINPRFNASNMFFTLSELNITASNKIIINSPLITETNSSKDYYQTYGGDISSYAQDRVFRVYNLGPVFYLGFNAIIDNPSRAKKLKVEIILEADDLVSAVVERYYHIDKDNNVVNYEDRFFSLSPKAIAIGMEIQTIIFPDFSVVVTTTLPMSNPTLLVNTEDRAIIRF